MRGRGRWGAIVVAAVREHRFIGLAGEARTRRSSPAASEAEKRPSSAAAAAPSPRRHGEKGPARAFTRMQPCIPATAPAFPSPRASGEKVVRQHRMRGVGGGVRSTLQPCARAASSALPVKHGLAVHQRLPVKQKSAPHPRLPPHLLPVATGRRDPHAFSPECSLRSCDSASLPSPRAAGRRWCGSTG